MNSASSQRIEEVQSPVIPIIGQWIAEHPGTISLGQGVVHFAPPDSVRQTVSHALGSDATLDRYGPVRGMESLIGRIAEKVSKENGIDLDGRSLVFTAGSNMGFLNAILAVADIGDEVILLSPYYFNHHMAVEIAGCKPVIVPTDDQYQIDLKPLTAALTSRTRAVVTVSPNNPTGAVYSRQTLTAVNRLCRQHGCFHISDEAYEYFTYDPTDHFSPGALPDSASHTISLYSLSKAYGMAGWRCGYMILPNHLETCIKKIQDTNLICPPIVCQIAAAAALATGSEWCGRQIDGLRAVREQVLQELAGFGARCRVPRPDGAFYVLIQLDTAHRDMDLVESLIRDFGVAVLPGCTFGVDTGCALRISYGALEATTVAEGIGRLKRGLERLL